MEREDLVGALGGAGEAGTLCRQALLDGADLVVLPGSVPTASLRDIYRSRAEHLRRLGIAAIGADEAADQLDGTSHAALRIASVDGGTGGYYFQLFLDPAGEQVVACLAVPHRDGGVDRPSDS